VAATRLQFLCDKISYRWERGFPSNKGTIESSSVKTVAGMMLIMRGTVDDDLERP